MEPPKAKVKRYHTFTSEGTMDQLVQILNEIDENRTRGRPIYIEPIILKGPNQEERYGYRVIFDTLMEQPNAKPATPSV
jgi:hypothetical protein